MSYFSVHNHSRYSAGDALSDLGELVQSAIARDYPVLGLTDHGTVAGLPEFYKLARKAGIEPAPGLEAYVTRDHANKEQGNNLHLTVNAYSERGYRNLCRLVTTTAHGFHYKPRLDLGDLAQMAEDGATSGLAISTGCWFGLLPTTLRTQGFAAAKALLLTLAGWFPKVFVELQAHGIEQEGELTEDDMVEQLTALANVCGLPYIITSDAHYVNPEDQPLHDGLKRMLTWNPEDPDDAVFPGDAYCLADRNMLRPYFPEKVLDTAIANLEQFAEGVHCRIPEIEQFRMLVPDVTPGRDQFEVLESKIHDALQQLGDTGADKDQVQRAQEELEVVRVTGMAGYLLLVAMVTDYMRAEGIVFNTRGSANDFYLNYLLGITGVDSHKRKLRPERFLSEDRIKPPDIDLDVEHARRPQVGAWLGKHFSVRQVGTIMKYSLTGDPADLDEDEDESARGSLRVKYFSAMKRAGRTIETWRDVPEEDKKLLHQLSDRKLVSGYGKHPAGYIVAPDEASLADLPLAYIASSKTFIGAYGKDDVEDLGFTKLDLLGLKTLTAVRIAVETILDSPNYEGPPGLTPMEFLESIPENDPATMKRIAAGMCEGLFQLGGPDQSRSVPRMKPRKTDDLIVAQALFRPAARGIQADYLARRKKVDPIPELHPDIWAETKNTYGLFIYQEQVIGALRQIGMSIVELNKLLKAVKASNEYVAGAKVAIAEAMPRIRQLAGARGWSDSDVELLADAVSGYADYGFNEAHAVAYGLLAYRTAWLAEHWPLAWWLGMLTAYSNTKRENPLRMAARRYKTRIRPPHVNDSGVTYTVSHERNEIRRGLVSVKDVGLVTARELVAHQPYASLQDLGTRVTASKVSGSKGLALRKKPAECGGAVASLDEVDAFYGLPPYLEVSENGMSA
jgi:DNA polymerase-3 subunit alpha